MNRFTRDDARRLHFDAAALGAYDRALAVDRVAERVDHAAEQALADRDVHDGAGPLHGVAFRDVAVIAEDNDAHVVVFEVQRHALETAGEFDHFTGLDIVESVDASDTVTHRHARSDFGDVGLGTEIGDLFFQDGGDFRGADFHQPAPFITSFILSSWVLSEESIIRLDFDHHSADQGGVDLHR